MSAATVTRYAATMPGGDLLVDGFWLDCYDRSGWCWGAHADTGEEALRDAAEAFTGEDDLRRVEVSAVCWPSMRLVRVATVQVGR
jgi:hypothetical protein